MLDLGYLQEIEHPEEDLKIIRYTQKAVDDSHWNRETLAANTLIVDNDYRFVSRPFTKVLDISEYTFNPKLGELLWNKYPMVVTEKIDGTMGVLYFVKDKPFIATPDGFDTPDALVANQILEEKYAKYDWEDKYTYVFEIVYPGNKNLIDYAESRDLILLALVDRGTGIDDYGYHMTLGFTNEFITPQFVPANLSWQEMLKFVSETGVSEGIVIRFADGKRVKFLTDEYLLKLERRGK